MITLTEARKRIDEAVKRLPPASVPLLKAVGCCVSEDIIAPINVPNFSSSSMDGIALRFSDLKGDGPWRLPIQEVITAGNLSQAALKDMHAIKIMTGAPLIESADTVIPIEDVTVESDRVIIKNRPTRGDFVRSLGDDIVEGQLIFSRDNILNPIDVGVLASIGLTDVKVVPKPAIALLSTGSEIVEPGERLKPGQIYGSNDTVLHAMLAYDRCRLSGQRRLLPDDLDVLCETIRECLEDHDLVISTGGVSMGDFDFIPEAVEKLGGNVLFHKVAVKPGKPIFIAGFNGRWFVGLPGNPVSVVVSYHLYVRRIISRLTGVESKPRSASAILTDDITVEDDRFYFVGARLEETANGIIAVPAVRQMSGRLSSISGINGLIMVEGGPRTISKNARVNVEWII